MGRFADGIVSANESSQWDERALRTIEDKRAFPLESPAQPESLRMEETGNRNRQAQATRWGKHPRGKPYDGTRSFSA
jgi:hypothetical protein